MQFKYFIASIEMRPNYTFSVLRQKRLFDEAGQEIKLDPSESNYRCTLNPSTEIDNELTKLFADGVTLNSELQELVNNELKQTLEIWWTLERVADYQELQNANRLSSL